MASEDTTKGVGKILADSKKAAEEAAPQDVSFATVAENGHPDGYVGNPFKTVASRTNLVEDLTSWLAARNRDIPRGGDDSNPSDLPSGNGDMGNRGS